MIRAFCAKRMAVLLAVAMFGSVENSAEAASSHLWWDVKGMKGATCVYGEITVLATHAPIYYCGANWHPGEPAGGYCGIQHNSQRERRTIFSIWDTSPTLHPKVTFADPQTIHNRFGGEGEGGHTHMLWNWQAGMTFQFFVQKQPGVMAETTDTRYFIFDTGSMQWRHSATITSPQGDEKSAASVSTIGGGGLVSFLENFGGEKDKSVAKLALYRLWVGTAVDELKCLTTVKGNGQWGQLDDCYFLAEGGEMELQAVFAAMKQQRGEPVFGRKGIQLPPISERVVSAETVKGLQGVINARRALQ